jgi:hypothetical protein
MQRLHPTGDDFERLFVSYFCSANLCGATALQYSYCVVVLLLHCSMLTALQQSYSFATPVQRLYCIWHNGYAAVMGSL